MNWDKPLSLAKMRDDDFKKVLEYHGYKPIEENWQVFISDCGYKSGDGWALFHDRYLSYCKLRQSPLFQALE